MRNTLVFPDPLDPLPPPSLPPPLSPPNCLFVFRLCKIVWFVIIGSNKTILHLILRIILFLHFLHLGPSPLSTPDTFPPLPLPPPQTSPSFSTSPFSLSQSLDGTPTHTVPTRRCSLR